MFEFEFFPFILHGGGGCMLRDSFLKNSVLNECLNLKTLSDQYTRNVRL